MSLYKLPLSVLRSKLPELSAEKTSQLLAVAAKLGLPDPMLAEQVGALPGSGWKLYNKFTLILA